MSVRLAIFARLLSRPAVLAAHAVSLITLSRLLTPTEFGLFALASIAHQIAVSAADLGVKSQLLKSTFLAPRQHGEALGLALASSSVVGALFAGAVFMLPGDLVPSALEITLYVLVASVFLGPLDLLFNIPLMQSMKFGLISVVNVIGAWIRCIVSIIAALLEAGPAALAIGVLAEQVVSFTLFALLRRKEQMPLPRLTGWRRLAGDGARLSLGQVVRYTCELVMMGAISGLLGAAALGVYNRAGKVVKLFDTVFLTSIEPVILPAFAKALEEGHAPALVHLKKVELLAALGWPAFAVIAILAEPLCLLLLGPGWDAAVVIVQLMALAGVAIPFSRMSQTLFIAMDEVSLGTRLDMVHHVTSAVLASAGALISLEMACIGLLAAQIINAVRQSRAFKRTTGYDTGTLWLALRRAAFLTLCAALPTALVQHMMTPRHEFWVFLAAAMAGGACFAAAVFLTRHILADEAKRAFKRLIGQGWRRA